jgi:hypothetical protein
MDNRPEEGGMRRRSTLIFFLSMLGVAVIIELRLLLGGVAIPSMQHAAGSLVAETLVFFGLFGQLLRYLEDKKRGSSIVMIVLLAILLGLVVTTYLKLH